MNDKAKIVKKAAVELGVDKPILSAKVVGNRVELHLLGGSTAVLDLDKGLPVVRWQLFSQKKLRALASEYHIKGRSKMSRAELIEALKAVKLSEF